MICCLFIPLLIISPTSFFHSRPQVILQSSRTSGHSQGQARSFTTSLTVSADALDGIATWLIAMSRQKNRGAPRARNRIFMVLLLVSFSLTGRTTPLPPEHRERPLRKPHRRPPLCFSEFHKAPSGSVDSAWR